MAPLRLLRRSKRIRRGFAPRSQVRRGRGLGATAMTRTPLWHLRAQARSRRSHPHLLAMLRLLRGLRPWMWSRASSYPLAGRRMAHPAPRRVRDPSYRTLRERAWRAEAREAHAEMVVVTCCWSNSQMRTRGQMRSSPTPRGARAAGTQTRGKPTCSPSPGPSCWALPTLPLSGALAPSPARGPTWCLWGSSRLLFMTRPSSPSPSGHALPGRWPSCSSSRRGRSSWAWTCGGDAAPCAPGWPSLAALK
mmetsp:Transcript_9269/g.27482  ORF Transcript_9269/g.27482 Transcript_9269/m.27482 type:complete len:249 (+) Transcript_9269:616-1362(+)